MFSILSSHSSQVVSYALLSTLTSAFWFLYFRLDTTENALKGPRDSLAFIGQNATFTCFSSLGSCVGMTWHKYRISRNNYAAWYTLNYVGEPRPGQKYIIEDVRLGCKMTVTNVMLADSGLFKCRFINNFQRIAGLFPIGK